MLRDVNQTLPGGRVDVGLRYHRGLRPEAEKPR